MAVFKINSDKKRLPSVYLGVSDDKDYVCEDYEKDPSIFYIENSTDFESTTKLYTDEDGINLASVAWYSNGSKKREWDGNDFITEESCS